MSWEANGGYWGPRPAGPSPTEASGWWRSRAQFQYRRDNVWPSEIFPVLRMTFTDGLLDDSTYGRSVSTIGTVTHNADGYADISASSAIQFAASESLELPGDFTIEAWVYMPTLGTMRIMGAAAVTGQAIFQCASVSGGTFIFSATGTGGNVTMTASGYPLVQANTWHHYAFVRSSGEVRAYLDGEWLGVATNTSDALLVGQSLSFPRIGAFSNVVGRLDDVTITPAAKYLADFTPPVRTE